MTTLMSSEPKHRLISRELLAEIAAGKYGPSGRLPSEAQLVKRYQVARPTVARALRDLQDQGLVERRVGSGSFVRKGSVSLGETQRQLGLLISGLGTTEIFDAICGELAGLARVHEYSLLWGGDPRRHPHADLSVDDADEICEQLIRRGVNGVFFTPFERVDRKEEINLRLAERLRRAGIAVVLLDRDLGPFPTRSDFDLVGIDNFAGGYFLADHLLKLGCRDLAFALRERSAPTVAARVAGARAAILDRGLAVPLDFARVGEPTDPQYVRSLAQDMRIEAILCGDDHIAATLLRAFEALGMSLPKDLRLVGFDDVKYATLLSVPLTTMHQPCRDLAITAFRTMLDRIGDPALPARSVSLSPRLVVRESCGAYPSSRAR